MSKVRRALCASSALPLVAGAGAAQAQSQQQRPTATSAQAADESGTGALQDIVVTAERRESTVQKTPIAITVVNGEDLARQNKSRLDDILRNQPGVQLQNGFAGFIVNIRGVTNNAGGTADYPTTLYQDGVISQVEIETKAAYVDINRVEVLRGPQGTLYGGNALGGAVNIISNDPKLDTVEAVLTAGAGNYSQIRGEAVANIPVSSSIAIRAVYAGENRDGYLSTGQNDSVYQVGKLKVLFEPSQDFRAVLTAMYTKVGGEGAGTLNSPYPLSLTELANPYYHAPLGVTVVTNANILSLRGTIEGDLGFAKLTFVPAYTDVRQHQIANQFGPLTDATFHHMRDTEELRLSSEPSSRLTWVAGLYRFHYNTPYSSINLQNGTTQATGSVAGQFYNGSTQEAVFAQATYPLIDSLRVTGGIRYTWGHREQYSFRRQNTSPLSTYDSIGRIDFNAVTWKGQVEYDLSPRSMVYAGASKGFRAGGLFNPSSNGGPTPVMPSFQNETMIDYEGGIKNRLLNNRLQLNLSAFYYDFQNYQISSTNLYTGDTVVYNAQGVKEYGAELETQFALTPVDRANLNVSYLHARFGDNQPPFAGGTVPDPYQIAGKPIDHAPQWMVSGGLEHQVRLNSGGTLTPRADVNYVSGQKVYFDGRCSGNGLACYQPQHALVDLSLNYTSPDERWTITAYVRNLSDYPVITGATYTPGIPVPVTVTVDAPRTFGATVRLKLGGTK